MASTLRIAFLADPVATFQVGHDSTFAVMVECARRGHEVFAFEQRDLRFENACAEAVARRLEVKKVAGDHFRVLDEKPTPLGEFDALFLRKDPPVDVEFLHATQMVDLATRPRRPFFVNEPGALRDANEKLFALRFPELSPKTVVSADPKRLKEFLVEVGGDMVVKPIDGFGGRGILHLHRGDRNVNSILEIATEHGKSSIIAQEYLPASREGDKRILVIEGEPVGAMLRVPQDDDVRGNLAAGGRYVRSPLTARDHEICARLAPDLVKRGLWFVGIDVIGGLLTEINVTSPTGIEEVNRLESTSVEGLIVDLVERKVGTNA